ncbi:MAG: class IIb bacteriocin, lactobin A/cerein 7B family [Bacteroidales bacterium]
MKELKFDGMTELQDAEVMEVNGGGWWFPALIGGTILADIILDYKESYDALIDGYTERKNNR